MVAEKGERTWTGMSFQVADVVQGASEVVAAGGKLSRDPEPENGEPLTWQCVWTRRATKSC